MSVHDSELEQGVDAGPDPELADLLTDIGGWIDRDVTDANVPWDFAAVVRRAHTLDPEQFPASVVQEVETAEPVVSLAQQRRARRATRDDLAFAAIVADVRADAELDTALRANGVASPASPAVAVARPASGLRRLAWGALALAAAVVLGVGVIEGVQFVQAQRAAQADAAMHQGDRNGASTERAVVDDTPAPQPRVRAAAPIERAAPEPEVLPPAPLDPPAAATAKPRRASKPAAVVAPPEPSLSERLAALDEAAHAAWKAGDLAAAEAKFEALIDLAGTSRLADLAYGDLFTLARRRGDSDREAALWRAYLERFAHGRFADDARAGLCRRASGEAQRSCWREYLEDMPQGSYRDRALRELGESP
ncbi:MAG: hypothetical protein K1X88_19345 [Nannocystaceae bacterium]|nr:hypothetical protein [Nannocystaceae bacterium]